MLTHHLRIAPSPSRSILLARAEIAAVRLSVAQKHGDREDWAQYLRAHRDLDAALPDVRVRPTGRVPFDFDELRELGDRYGRA